MDKPRSIARKLATRQWGSPDSQKTLIPSRLWLFETPRHGGYVYRFDGGPPRWAELDYESAYTSFDGTYVSFEEDCNWAVLMCHRSDAAAADYAYLTTWMPKQGITPPSWAEYQDRALEVVKRYHPEVAL